MKSMNRTAEEWKRLWLEEERQAHIKGWDFSHIVGRYTEQEDLPWSYEALIRQALTPEQRILDIDTGGGELLLSLVHPHANTAATEGYPPNVALCQRTLTPLGIDFRPADGKAHALHVLAPVAHAHAISGGAQHRHVVQAVAERHALREREAHFLRADGQCVPFRRQRGIDLQKVRLRAGQRDGLAELCLCLRQHLHNLLRRCHHQQLRRRRR